ncbi:hypothetical protein CGCVW01_v005353, partial [Colletotrichum viniferum]
GLLPILPPQEPKNCRAVSTAQTFRNLTYALANSFPLPRPQEPTTSNNHALLRMMYTRRLLHTTPNPTDSSKLHESSGS